MTAKQIKKMPPHVLSAVRGSTTLSLTISIVPDPVRDCHQMFTKNSVTIPEYRVISNEMIAPMTEIDRAKSLKSLF
ncbi:MAG: hypothetical protein KDA86_05525 [Planctomycetaceae bacterium]|nr:hypothetical protein [Planctomycetaceae bacterium]